MKRNYYITDIHFGHKNVLKNDHRPFSDLEEMENVIVHNWNATVGPDDTTYILVLNYGLIIIDKQKNL